MEPGGWSAAGQPQDFQTLSYICCLLVGRNYSIVHVLYLFPAFAPSTVPKEVSFSQCESTVYGTTSAELPAHPFFLGLVGSDSFLPDVFERPDITGPSQIWTQFVPPHSILYATRLHEYPSLYPPFRCCGLLYIYIYNIYCIYTDCNLLLHVIIISYHHLLPPEGRSGLHRPDSQKHFVGKMPLGGQVTVYFPLFEFLLVVQYRTATEVMNEHFFQRTSMFDPVDCTTVITVL